MADYSADALRQYAYQAAVNAGIDPNIFLAQINQESGFNPYAQSGAGAVGIAQIMPQYHPGVDPTDPYASLDYAAQLDANALQQYGGDWRLALAAYNAGGGAVAQYGGVPPFPETQNYVNSILGESGGGMSFDPNADPNNPPPPDGGGDTGGNFWDWLTGALGGAGSAIGGLFGGGGDTTPTPTGGTQPPFDRNLDQVTNSIALGGGHHVTYVSHIDGNTYEAFDPNPATGTASRTLEDAARANNFFKPDGTPDVNGYLAYQAQQHGGTASYKSLEAAAASAGYYNADGTPDTAGFLAHHAATAAGSSGKPSVINLGSGNYLTVGADGSVQEHSFGGGTGASGGPPSLDPSRSSIVAYLQALLHQNDLPYAGIGKGTPNATPAATPAASVTGALTGPTPVVGPPPAPFQFGTAAPGLNPGVLPGVAPGQLNTVAPAYNTTNGVHNILGAPVLSGQSAIPGGWIGAPQLPAPAPFQFSSLGLQPGVLPPAGAPSLLQPPDLTAPGALTPPLDPNQPKTVTRSY